MRPRRSILLARIGTGLAAFCIAIGMAVLPSACGGTADVAAALREPAVAGQFYPEDAGKLRKAVESFLADARPGTGRRPLAILSPHAGYAFSGQIAADAFEQAAGFDYDLVVVLGTNHTSAGFDGVSVWAGGTWRTPLGDLVVDEKLAAALIAKDSAFTFEPAVHAREHSVEVQLPFIQVLFPGTPILPVVIGRPDPDLCERFGRDLAELLRGRRALIVASSDLSHYPTYEDAILTDQATLEAFCSLDAGRLERVIEEGMRARVPELVTCACGEGPMLALIAAARALGASHADLISAANSGDGLLGDRRRVVGYGAASITRLDADPGNRPEAQAPSDAPFEGPLDTESKRRLLSFARETIRRYLETETVPLPRDLPPALSRRQGAFVTLEKQGVLRGCIGYMAEDEPLGLVVGKMALAAAFDDRRFSPLRPDELAAVEIEISVLTPFASVAGPEAIVLGTDGIVLRKGGRSAVYLPQVAPEQGWDLAQTLSQLCLKAGLEGDCWQAGAELSTFQAEVFAESDFN